MTPEKVDKLKLCLVDEVAPEAQQLAHTYLIDEGDASIKDAFVTIVNDIFTG